VANARCQARLVEQVELGFLVGSKMRVDDLDRDVAFETTDTAAKAARSARCDRGMVSRCVPAEMTP
jgi:hypothetical protein